MDQRPNEERTIKLFNGAKVFSATMAQDREFLGDKVTAWIQSNPRRQVVDTIVTLSSGTSLVNLNGPVPMLSTPGVPRSFRCADQNAFSPIGVTAIE